MIPNVAHTTRSPMSSAVAGGLPLKGGFLQREGFRSARASNHHPTKIRTMYEIAYQRMAIGPRRESTGSMWGEGSSASYMVGNKAASPQFCQGGKLVA